MRDPRTRLLVLILLNVAHGVARDTMVLPLAGVSLLVAALHFRGLARGLPAITMTAVVLVFISALTWLMGVGLDTNELVFGTIRWLSLVVLTVSLVLSMNALEMVTSLVYFRIPIQIALACGVGLRFLPIIIEEAGRIRIVQQQYGIRVSRAGLKKYGPMGLLSRMTTPLLVAILRRVDSLLISISVQQLEQRITEFRYPSLRVTDLICVLAAVGVCSLAWAL